jgi:hypothetical protein
MLLRYTREIKFRIAMTKAAFNKKKVLFRQQTGYNFKEETIQCNIWSIPSCGVEN